IQTWGSAPQPVDSKLLVDADGNFLGSVSGGCVEASVVAEAAATEVRKPSRGRKATAKKAPVATRAATKTTVAKPVAKTAAKSARKKTAIRK
ncbi:MAG: XdhC family protein, partial [Gemmatimonadales bacterium]